MRTYKCIVIDDDEIDRLTVVSFVKKNPDLTLVASFESADEALAQSNFETIDVLFLDIDMPGTNGIEFRRRIDKVPACIFITAYPEHALDSFSVETLDFIVKPIKYPRFEKAIDKLHQFISIREKAQLYENHIGGDYIHIKEGHQETRVNIRDIFYLEALKDYTLVVTEGKRHCTLISLGNLLKEQGFGHFVRIHRSFAVTKEKVKLKKSTELTLANDIVLPVGRSFKDNLNVL